MIFPNTNKIFILLFKLLLYGYINVGTLHGLSFYCTTHTSFIVLNIVIGSPGILKYLHTRIYTK